MGVESWGRAGMGGELGSARIVQLKPGGPGPCIFLIPGTGGRIDGFANLAPHLQIPLKVFAVEARGLDEESLPDTSVDDMAEHYLAQIRAVQAAGPYFLLGHSFGGLVALELAQRLIDAKEKIACLILLDTPTPEKCWPFSFYLRSRWAKLRRLLTKVTTIPLRENIAAYRRSLSLRGADLNAMPLDVMIGDNCARVLLAHGIARKAYSPKFYAGRVIFFRPLEMPDHYELLWRDLIPDMDIYAAAGGHLSMLDPPRAPLLAADLSKCLLKILAAAEMVP
jgi:thioesterase domain-containing protein